MAEQNPYSFIADILVKNLLKKYTLNTPEKKIQMSDEEKESYKQLISSLQSQYDQLVNGQDLKK